MRRLGVTSLILLLFANFDMVQAQNTVTLPSVRFCGLIGETPKLIDDGSQEIANNATSVFYPACRMDVSEQNFIQHYRHYGRDVKSQNIQGYRGLVIDTLPPPEHAKLPPEQTFNAELRGIYIYNKKQLIGYHLMTNTSVDYYFEDDPLLMQIKALPKQTLTHAPGGTPVPPGLIVEEYDASTTTHIEKFLFVRSSEIQVILTHSFYPRPLQVQMDEMMADKIAQNLREIHKRWAD